MRLHLAGFVGVIVASLAAAAPVDVGVWPQPAFVSVVSSRRFSVGTTALPFVCTNHCSSLVAAVTKRYTALMFNASQLYPTAPLPLSPVPTMSAVKRVILGCDDGE